MKITLSVISLEYRAAVQACFAIYPKERWQRAPRAILGTTKKGVYGECLPDGTVYVNQGFIGTEAINKLRETIRHELAHLAVGLSHGHDRHFRAMEARFCQGIDVPEAEVEQIKANINFKWRVTAHLEDGTDFDLGGVHRRTKRYTDYPDPKRGAYMNINGTTITSFSFKPYT